MKGGVYEIVNLVNGKRYVGSAVDFHARWKLHRFHLERRTHKNRHLQSSWSKHGSDSFVFRRLLVCGRHNNIFYEQRVLDVLQPEFNIRRIADSNLGVKLSAESRAKLSAAKKGNQATLGYRHSPESLAKLSAAKLGNTYTKGKKRNRAAVEKTAAAHRGMKRSAETRARISAAMTGKKRPPRSPETLAKMAAANRGRGSLKSDQVRAIREQRAARIPRSVVAATFNTSVSMVSAVAGRRRYGWVQ